MRLLLFTVSVNGSALSSQQSGECCFESFFLCFLHHFVLAKLANSGIRVTIVRLLLATVHINGSVLPYQQPGECCLLRSAARRTCAPRAAL